VLDKERVKTQLAAQQRKVEISQVRVLLEALQHQREVAEMRRMMPAYIRRFFQRVAPLVGAGLQGDIEGTFWLDPCPLSVQQALNSYPEQVQRNLTFDRELATPDLTRAPRAIYVHPGEPVFEAVTDLFLGRYDHQGMRGAVFFDDEITEAYIFYLARVAILRDPDPVRSGDITMSTEPEIVEEKVIGVRRFENGRCEFAPAHLLLTLHPADPEAEAQSKPASAASLVKLGGNTVPVEAFLIQEWGHKTLQECRREEEQRLPQQQEQLRVAYNLRQAELFRQKRALKEAVERDIPAARSKLRQCETELGELDRRRREAEASLSTRIDRLRLGPVSLYAQALVLPMPPEEAERRRDTRAEEIALAEVRQREKALGSTIEDVSAPHLKAGFDLKVLRPNGEIRYVEVKGRSGRQAIEMTENEWAQAANHRDRYWLYAVYDCDAVAQLYRVPDPFGNLLARQTGAVRIKASEVMTASENHE
jgi:hypothetical protein